ncbi:phage portal protein [Anaerotruncus rubiinfantis]|uniref:phage portal protein n=1 Tax=Anaerotruncus rubiinfantis TaxID=1720200 RepID=UPI0011CC7387|nr:phage portal protein [Anaerotruncus rubiinfantis]
MSLIGRMILPFNPKGALQYEKYRQLARSMYTAADQSPRSAGWTTINATGEQTNQASRDIVRARSRDLERNSDVLGGELLALERNVIGTGIVLQAKVLGGDGKENEDLNEQIETLWREWCRPGNCEITGRLSLFEVETMIVRRRFIDGGILIVKVKDADEFQLQLIEVDDLDSTVQACNDHNVIGGIEIDKFRRPVAYHIKVYDAWGFHVRTDRIDADRVIYLPFLSRPSQVREFAMAAASLPRIDDVNELLDSAVDKERVVSHLSLAIESDTGTIGGLVGMGRGGIDLAGQSESEGSTGELLEQGTIVRLKPGDKVSVIGQPGTSSTVDPLVKTTQRLAGSSAGLSYEVVSRDMSQVNYSSARQGLLEDQRTYRIWQKYLIEHFCDVIYSEWLDWMILTRRLNISDYYSRRAAYQRHIWIAGGWDWIDPLKEVSANAKALETNQTTLQEICASKGKDYRDILRQRKIELDLIHELIENESDILDEKDTGQQDPESQVEESAAATIADQGDSIQTVSLNGAQIDSLIAIVQMVVTGKFPFDSAVAILTAAFPFDDETAKKILNNGLQIKIEEDEDGEK